MSHKMKSVEEKYKIQRGYYARGLVDAKDEITHNCHNVNMTNERTMDALYYVDKLKQGTVLWEHNVRQQIAKLDEKALAIWKEYLNDVAKSTDNVNAEKLMKMLTSASRAARKRNDIPDEFGNSLKTASKIVNSLMDAKSGSLSSNRMYIEELNTNVKVMRKALPFITCIE
ncbi:uncharacterized protein LOC130649305 [Hydractinia symbiolongicarpus]|uniref:uncharacterized protein LOC130649305 n=1 Tax=Hydractinia symbiolongicarpus TaxID=13093 RepID=UPI00254E8249|nr:uncharacterized protein LOC130649305 [Hydractinia symbiolongicarpus]